MRVSDYACVVTVLGRRCIGDGVNRSGGGGDEVHVVSRNNNLNTERIVFPYSEVAHIVIIAVACICRLILEEIVIHTVGKTVYRGTFKVFKRGEVGGIRETRRGSDEFIEASRVFNGDVNMSGVQIAASIACRQTKNGWNAV